MDPVSRAHVYVVIPARERADFALGSRFLGQAPNLPLLRRLMLQAATAFSRLTTDLQVTDVLTRRFFVAGKSGNLSPGGAIYGCLITR